VELFFGRSIIQARAFLREDPERILYTTLSDEFEEKAHRYHVIFCVDTSSSMKNTKPAPLSSSPFKKSHNNRLGAVFDACQTFLEARESVKPYQTFQEYDPNDKYTLITFHRTAEIIFEKISVSPTVFHQKVIPLQPAKQTDYTAPLELILKKKLN